MYNFSKFIVKHFIFTYQSMDFRTYQVFIQTLQKKNFYFFATLSSPKPFFSATPNFRLVFLHFLDIKHFHV